MTCSASCTFFYDLTIPCQINPCLAQGSACTTSGASNGTDCSAWCCSLNNTRMSLFALPAVAFVLIVASIAIFIVRYRRRCREMAIATAQRDGAQPKSSPPHNGPPPTTTRGNKEPFSADWSGAVDEDEFVYARRKSPVQEPLQVMAKLEPDLPPSRREEPIYLIDAALQQQRELPLIPVVDHDGNVYGHVDEIHPGMRGITIHPTHEEKYLHERGPTDRHHDSQPWRLSPVRRRYDDADVPRSYQYNSDEEYFAERRRDGRRSHQGSSSRQGSRHSSRHGSSARRRYRSDGEVPSTRSSARRRDSPRDRDRHGSEGHRSGSRHVSRGSSPERQFEEELRQDGNRGKSSRSNQQSRGDERASQSPWSWSAQPVDRAPPQRPAEATSRRVHDIVDDADRRTTDTRHSPTSLSRRHRSE